MSTSPDHLGPERPLRPLRELPTTPAGLLLARAAALPDPPLSPRQQARIAATLARHTAAERPRHAWLLGAALAGAAALVAVLLLDHRPPAPTLARHEPPAALPSATASLAPPPPSRAPPPAGREIPAARRFVLRGGAQLLLLGEGALARVLEGAPGSGPAEVALDEGRLLIRSGTAGVRVHGPDRVVTVAPQGLAEVVVRAVRVTRVAAYVGTAIVATGAVVMDVLPGRALDEDGQLGPAPGRGQAERLLPEAAPRSRLAAAPPPRPAPPLITEAAPAGTLQAESQILAQALRHLRQDQDATAALAELDRHRAAFPAGALQQEAALARVEAHVLRGDQQAAAGRCAAAESDYGAALTLSATSAPGLSASQTERALYGRAGCRARRGDRDGANLDLRELLRRAPSGRFSDDAREALGR